MADRTAEDPAAPERTQEGSGSPAKQRWLLWALAATVVGAALRFWGIGSEGLWHDEAVTFHLADVPWSDLMAVFRSGEQTPLFPLMLRAWRAVFGTSEAALRSLSAVCGVAGIPLLAWAGARIHSRAAGLWAGWIYALSPLAVHYAQELRPYTFIMAVVPLALLALLGLRDRGGLGRTLIVGLLLALLPLTHHTGALFVFALVMGCLFPWPGTRGALRLLAAGAVAAALWGGWTFSSPDPVVRSQTRLAVGVMDEGSLLTRVPRSLSTATPGTVLPVRNRARRIDLRGWTAVGLWAVLLAIALLRWPKGTPRAARTVLVLTPLLHLALLAVPERLGAPAWIVGRTDTFNAPLLMLGLACGLACLDRRAGLSLGMVLLALGLPPLEHHYAMDHRSQERILAQRVLSAAGPDDLVVTTGVWDPALHYYALRAEDPPELWSFPRGFERRNRNPGWEHVLGGRPLAEVAEEYVETIAASDRRGLWLVLDERGTYRPLARALDSRFRPTARFAAPPPLPVTVFRYERIEPGTEL